jgi:group I intron endonuclease
MYLYKDKLYNRTLNATGIYAIVNTVNDKFYIGSGIGQAGLKARKNCHLSQLRRGVHENSYLQSSWYKYGEDAFEFWVLGLCSKKDGLQYEQLFINLLCPHYNLCKSVRKEYYEFKHKEDYFRKVGNVFELVSPEGTVVKGQNLRNYCRENNLNYGSLRNIVNGETRFNFDGWTGSLEDHCAFKKYGYVKDNLEDKSVIVLDPKNNEHIVYSPYKFAKDHNLSTSHFIGLVKGENKSLKGWRLKKTEQELKLEKENLGVSYFFISPEGRMFTGKNIKVFALEKGLSVPGMTSLNSGKCQLYNGWTTTFENYLKFKYYGSCSNHHFRKPTKVKNTITKEKVVVYGAKKFCETYALQESSVCRLLKGKIKKYKGWMLDV